MKLYHVLAAYDTIALSNGATRAVSGFVCALAELQPSEVGHSAEDVSYSRHVLPLIAFLMLTIYIFCCDVLVRWPRRFAVPGLSRDVDSSI